MQRPRPLLVLLALPAFVVGRLPTRRRAVRFAPAVVDPDGQLEAAPRSASNEVDAILPEGSRIQWVARYRNSEVSSRLDALLGAP